MHRRASLATRRPRVAALACLAALMLAMVGVPAMHASVHARESATAPRRGPVIRVTHGFSEEVPHRHADGSWHQASPADAHDVGAPAHHHHDDDQAGEHGRGALEHFGVAVLATAPVLIAPPWLVEETHDTPPAVIAAARARARDTWRSRGPPDAT